MEYRHNTHTVISAAIILGATFCLAAAACASSQPNLPALRVSVGQAAPDFTLPSTTGKPVALSSFRGHTVLLDFYEGYW